MKKTKRLTIGGCVLASVFCASLGVCALPNQAKAETENITENAYELPLEALVENGGLASIFNKIACIGDSLSSGALEEHTDVGVIGHDEYGYSWGQYMQRTLGNTVYNFSRGGMTAKEYCDSFAEENGYWSADLACDAYYIALGVNDLFTHYGTIAVGSTQDIKADWRENEKTFAGYIGQIVQRLQANNPNACFFFVSMPSDGNDPIRASLRKQHTELLYGLAEYFDNSFVIDLEKYAPEYDADFQEKYYVGGHLSTAGYYLTSKMILSYTDYIVRHNTQVFRDAGLKIPENYTYEVPTAEYGLGITELVNQPLTADPSNNYWCGLEGDDMAYFAPQWNVANPGTGHQLAYAFVAPADGTVTPNVSTGGIGEFHLNYQGSDGARIAVYLNEQRIFPVDKLWEDVAYGSNTVASSSVLELKAGDTLYYLLDNGGNGNNDSDAVYFMPGFVWSDAKYSNLWVDASAGSCGWTSADSGEETVPTTTYKKKDISKYYGACLTRPQILPVCQDGELPLEKEVHDEGFASLFQDTVLIGDMTSVYAEKISEFAKISVTDYASVGLTAQTAYETLSFRNADEKHAYIIALGETDLFVNGLALGTVSDTETSYAYYLGKLLQKINEKAPQAKIFLVSLPKNSEDDETASALRSAYAELLADFVSATENAYLVDLYAYGTENADESTLAQETVDYIDYIVKKQVLAFKKVGIPVTKDPEYVEENDEYTLLVEDMVYQPLTIDPNNSYWCGVPDDDVAYFAPQWLTSNPGANHAIAICFTAPTDGCVYPDSRTGMGTVYLTNTTRGDGARFAIYLNNTRIYPEEALWDTVPLLAEGRLQIDMDAFKMHAGDKLYYVLESGGNGNNDLDGAYVLMGFHWANEGESYLTWYDSFDGGWGTEESGNALSSLGYPKKELLSYHYLTVMKTADLPQPEPPVEPDPPVVPDDTSDTTSDDTSDTTSDDTSDTTSDTTSDNNSDSASDSTSDSVAEKPKKKKGCGSYLVGTAFIPLLTATALLMKKRKED